MYPADVRNIYPYVRRKAKPLRTLYKKIKIKALFRRFKRFSLLSSIIYYPAGYLPVVSPLFRKLQTKPRGLLPGNLEAFPFGWYFIPVYAEASHQGNRSPFVCRPDVVPHPARSVYVRENTPIT